MAHYRDRKRQIFGPKELAMRFLRCFATCLLPVELAALIGHWVCFSWWAISC
jgi:hypothetical protein